MLGGRLWRARKVIPQNSWHMPCVCPASEGNHRAWRQWIPARPRDLDGRGETARHGVIGPRTSHRPEDAVVPPDVRDHVLLMPVHPAGEGDTE